MSKYPLSGINVVSFGVGIVIPDLSKTLGQMGADVIKIESVKSPDFMRGVVNVRGSMVPVIDLRKKFGLPETENTPDTRIVIMELGMNGETMAVGALADSVHEVTDLDSGQIEGTPKLGGKWRSEFIRGIGKNGGQFIMILDIDRVFSSDEQMFMGETETMAPASETAG